MNDDTDLPPGRYGLSRQQTFVMDRLHELISTEQECEKVLAPFMTDEISRVILRLRNLFDRAHKSMTWNDYASADIARRQAEGALRELRALGVKQGVNKLYFERVMR